MRTHVDFTLWPHSERGARLRSNAYKSLFMFISCAETSSHKNVWIGKFSTLLLCIKTFHQCLVFCILKEIWHFYLCMYLCAVQLHHEFICPRWLYCIPVAEISSLHGGLDSVLLKRGGVISRSRVCMDVGSSALNTWSSYLYPHSRLRRLPWFMSIYSTLLRYATTTRMERFSSELARRCDASILCNTRLLSYDCNLLQPVPTQPDITRQHYNSLSHRLFLHQSQIMTEQRNVTYILSEDLNNVEFWNGLVKINNTTWTIRFFLVSGKIAYIKFIRKIVQI